MRMKVIRSKRHLALVASNDPNDLKKVDGYIAVHKICRVREEGYIVWLGVISTQIAHAVPSHNLLLLSQDLYPALLIHNACMRVWSDKKNRNLIIRIYVAPDMPRDEFERFMSKFKRALREYEILVNPMDCFMPENCRILD